MKCQILFSGKNKKNIINLSSAENAQRVVKVNSMQGSLTVNLYIEIEILIHWTGQLFCSENSSSKRYRI